MTKPPEWAPEVFQGLQRAALSPEVFQWAATAFSNWEVAVEYYSAPPAEGGDLFAPDIVWHAAGRSYLAGTFQGRDEVLEMINGSGVSDRQPPFEVHILDIAISDEFVTALRLYTSALPDDPFSTVGVHVLQFERGRIGHVYRFDFDQEGFDRHVARWAARPIGEREAIMEAWRGELDEAPDERRSVRPRKTTRKTTRRKATEKKTGRSTRKTTRRKATEKKTGTTTRKTTRRKPTGKTTGTTTRKTTRRKPIRKRGRNTG